MDRLQKKCLVASCGMHGMLLLVIVFGAAFFTPEKKNPPVASMTMVPSRLIDGALSGGGGNPKIAPSEAKIKGDTLNPVPPQPQPVKPQPKTVEVPKPAPPKTDIPKDPPKTKQAPIDLKPLDKSASAKPKTQADKTKADPKAAQKQLANQISKIRENMRQGFNSGTAVEVSGPG